MKPKWVVVMDSEILHGEDCATYSMGIAIDDGCLVILREDTVGDSGWRAAGGWVPMPVVQRISELWESGELQVTLAGGS